jgi:hypothetical protein
MALSSDAVDAFLAAEKVVRARPVGMRWRLSGVDGARWNAAVEVDGIVRGVVWLQVNRSLPRTWNFQLNLHDETVLMWHFKHPVNHRNLGCPAEFPRRVRGAHEHIWIEGHGTNCAQELQGFDSLAHADVLIKYYERANIRSEVAYSAPGAGEQITIGSEEAED